MEGKVKEVLIFTSLVKLIMYIITNTINVFQTGWEKWNSKKYRKAQKSEVVVLAGILILHLKVFWTDLVCVITFILRSVVNLIDQKKQAKNHWKESCHSPQLYVYGLLSYDLHLFVCIFFKKVFFCNFVNFVRGIGWGDTSLRQKSSVWLSINLGNWLFLPLILLLQRLSCK